MARVRESERIKRPEDEVVVVGVRPHPIRDLYHGLLRLQWLPTLALVAAVFLVSNAVFAAIYFVVGGIDHAKSFSDCFFFSVHTIGTIGYGSMVPTTFVSNVVVSVESFFGLLWTALMTGLLFAKFSRSTARIVFSKYAVVGPQDGVPTLMFRVGNDRSSAIAEAIIRVAASRTERTKEGTIFYRMFDLALVRERSPALSRSWAVMHVIDEKSPLYRMNEDMCRVKEVELIVTITGTDDTSLQPVHARHRYTTTDIRWDAKLVDILSELPDGRLQLDLAKFDEVEPL